MKIVLLGNEQVKRIVARACREVEKKDSLLFEEDVSEWAIAHRLAFYLEKYLPEYCVDRGYNRMPGSNGRYGAKAPKKILGDKKIRPDIIVHMRGTNANNLLAIEMKKKTNREGSTVDKETLQAMKGELNYNFAYTLIIGIHNISEEWI